MDLIDRAEVQYKMLEILPEADSLEWYEQAKPEEVKELVDELYSIVLNVNRIDAQPVKHGKWITTQKTIDDGITTCSYCQREFYIDDLVPVGNEDGFCEFCPACGSDNRGDSDADS